jgi:hypothetical protein
MNKQELIAKLLSEPDKLKRKKPFTRGAERDTLRYYPEKVAVGETMSVSAPQINRYVIPQEQFLRELDPNCHDVLFDENIPSLCVKIQEGDYREVKYQRMAVPIQRELKNKQVMHLTAHPMQFTLMDTEPTDSQLEDFITFKQYWNLRNQDGMKTKMVDAQLSCGDAGLLYYFDHNGEIKSRLLSFADGYVLCPHNDANGDRVLECVYYVNNNIEYIDCYDYEKMYRFTKSIVYDAKDLEDTGWTLEFAQKHGFSEIPLISKRGDVAWNNVQPIVEAYEELYNVFNAIQKRFGWGIFYIKGRFKDTAKKIAGSVVLNDTSMEGNGDAKFLTPPTPQGTIDTLQLMLESIQLGASTTFLLPKDVKMSGDISGIAIMLTQSLDMENALQKVIEWQNVADKMVRLFKEGLSKELVNKNIDTTAITRYEELHINAKFKVWRPLNEYEYNQMLTILTGAGILSKESGIELNTVSKPDEKKRLEKQEKQAQEQLIQSQIETQNNKGQEKGGGEE